MNAYPPLVLSEREFDSIQNLVNEGRAEQPLQTVWDTYVQRGWIQKEGDVE